MALRLSLKDKLWRDEERRDEEEEEGGGGEHSSLFNIGQNWLHQCCF